jgi:hypothetical protein
MIINVYIPENDSKVIEKLKWLSSNQRRSFSFVIREALEYYLLNFARVKGEELHNNTKKEV